METGVPPVQAPDAAAALGANNGKGGSGVAPNCRVLPVRIAKGGGQDVRLN